MRKIVRIAALAALTAAVAWLVPVFADSHGKQGDEQSYNLFGEIRARGEVLENYEDLDDNDNEDSVSFGAWRVDFGGEAVFSKNVAGRVVLQGLGTWGGSNFPENGFGDPLGQTVITPDGDDSLRLDVFEAYVTLNDIGGSGTNLRVGREGHQIGNELHIGNLDFYNGTSYDGARVWWDLDGYRPQAFCYITDEEDVEEDRDTSFPTPNVDGEDDDITIGGFAIDIDVSDDGQHIEPYVLYYRDGQYEFGGGKVWTIGALYKRDMPEEVDGFEIDWSIEGAFQSGEFEPNGANLDYGGSIFEGWIGFNFDHGGSGHSRVHVGALIASGDDDAGDSDLDYFKNLFPDNHAYNRTGNLDLFSGGGNNTIQGFVNGFGLAGDSGISNVTDIFAGYGYHGDRHSFYGSLHQLSLTEDAIHQSVFGTMDDDIGLEIDLVYSLKYSDNVGFQIGASQLSNGDFVEELFGTDIDDISRMWAQLRLLWN